MPGLLRTSTSQKNDFMSEDTPMRMKTVSLCATIACLAGTPLALAQADRPRPANQQDQRQQDQRTNRQALNAAVNFQTFDDFDGREVYNSADDNVATIKDLIVDRGSGEIMHVVVQTGDFLGMGGKMIALPYSAFTWDSAEDRVELRYAKGTLENMSEFRQESWAGLLTEDNADMYDAAYKQLEREHDNWAKDPYGDSAKDYPTISIEGDVQRVVRPSDRSGQSSYLMVNTAQGPRKVILGPSWYVMGYSGAPERGDKITIQAYEVPREGERTYVARTFKTDRGEMTLRGNDGRAMWSNTNRDLSGDAGYVPFRYVLLSEVVGKDCTARGEDCGEVQKAIVECSSGQVAFLAIDPNENFLGIGDDLHLVPWSVSRVYADSVALDASKEMIVNSSPMPENMDDLDTASNWNAAYRTFDVDTPRFDRYDTNYDRNNTRNRGDNISDRGNAGDHAWYDRTDLREIVRNGTPETMTGTLVRTSTHEDKKGKGEKCSTIVLSTPGGEREVVVAPESFMKKNKLELDRGDRVTVQVVRAVVDGESMWIAKSITTGNDTHTLWNNDTPAWSGR